MCFFAKSEKNIRTPYDFVGKTIGMKYGTNIEAAYKALLQKFDIEADEIELIPAKFDMTPFFDDRVDIWTGYAHAEPLTAQLKGYDVTIIRAKDYGIQFYGNVYFTTDKFLNEHPDIIMKFTEAISRGWRYALEHPEETVEIAARKNPNIDKVQQVRSLEILRDIVFPEDSVEIGLMTNKQWNTSQQILLEQGIIDHLIPVEQLFSNEFIIRK